MTAKIVYIIPELAPGVEIKFSFLPDRTDTYGRADQVEVTIDIAGQGEVSQPDHWKPAYRAEYMVKFITTREQLIAMAKTLGELL